MVLKILLWSLITGVIGHQAFGFALLSSHDEARLPVSFSQPTIVFELTTQAPALRGQSLFLDGAYADRTGEDFWVALVEEAVARWNKVEGSFVDIRLDRNYDAAVDQTDRRYSIVVGNTARTSSAAARPVIEDGVIVDCDIVVNNTRPQAKSLAFTIMHEIGHCLGLGHNHADRNAVMSYARTNQDLSLGADDQAGLIYLYPSDQSNVSEEKLMGCGVIYGGVKGYFHIALLLLPIFLVVLVGKKDRSLRYRS